MPIAEKYLMIMSWGGGIRFLLMPTVYQEWYLEVSHLFSVNTCRGVWFSNTVEKFRRNEPVTIYSPDFETKNFVWAHDLARFVDTLITAETWKYNAVNLACSQGVSIREIAMKIKKLTESSSEIIVADGNRPPFCLDASRAAEMGYSSLTPLEIVSAYLND